MCWLCSLRLTMSSRVGVAPSFPRPAMLTIFDGDRGGMVGCTTGEGTFAPPWKEGDTSATHRHTIQGFASHVRRRNAGICRVLLSPYTYWCVETNSGII